MDCTSINVRNLLTSPTHPDRWSGTFLEYLDLVQQQPQIAQNAHQRIYAMIAAGGRDASGYRFFRDQLFGLDEVLNRLVDEYFRPAAMGYDLKKRLLLLVGPVSGGKSTFVTLLKQGLEQYSHTDPGALYAIAGCPMHQDPLLLLADPARRELERAWGISITGELNPYTRRMVQDQYGGKIDLVRVERLFFSESQRRGIGTFTPSDPKSQDISELVGSLDFVGISQYGSESDPRAYRFDGELNISNRGLMEFQEILKCDEKFLYPLLSLTQEGNFKTGRFALISADTVIVAHTNESEYDQFVHNPRNQALLSRMHVVRFPYHHCIPAEVRMLETRIPRAHFEPYALETAAAFAVATRSDDGMHGIDPRFMINCIAALVVNSEHAVHALDILACLKRRLPEAPGLDHTHLAQYLDVLQQVHLDYDRHLRDHIVEAAGVAAEERQLLQAYLVQLHRWYRGDAYDQRLMDQFESALDLAANQREPFRKELAACCPEPSTLAGAVKWASHPSLRDFVYQHASSQLANPDVIESALKSLGFTPVGALEIARTWLDHSMYCNG